MAESSTDQSGIKATEDLRNTLLFVVSGIAVGLFVVLLHNVIAHLSAALWSLAWLTIGILVGFLFGVPRVLQEDRPTTPPRSLEDTDGPSVAGRSSPYQMRVNTNLEQISDWLTKIIVGIGLVELRRIPEALNQSSEYIAKGFGTLPGAQALATGIIVYFSILGFLGGYLITRIYLAGAFGRADRDIDESLVRTLAPKPAGEQHLDTTIKDTLEAENEQVKTEISKVINIDDQSAKLQIDKIVDEAKNRMLNKIRQGGFLTFDSRPLLGERGNVWRVPYDQYNTVQALLNDIWSSNRVLPAFSYGERWILRDQETGYEFKEAGRNWAKRRGTQFDTRRLEDLGIKPGSTLEIAPLNTKVS